MEKVKIFGRLYNFADGMHQSDAAGNITIKRSHVLTVCSCKRLKNLEAKFKNKTESGKR